MQGLRQTRARGGQAKSVWSGLSADFRPGSVSPGGRSGARASGRPIRPRRSRFRDAGSLRAIDAAEWLWATDAAEWLWATDAAEWFWATDAAEWLSAAASRHATDALRNDRTAAAGAPRRTGAGVSPPAQRYFARPGMMYWIRASITARESAAQARPKIDPCLCCGLCQIAVNGAIICAQRLTAPFSPACITRTSAPFSPRRGRGARTYLPVLPLRRPEVNSLITFAVGTTLDAGSQCTS